MSTFVDPGFVDPSFVEEKSLLDLLSNPEARINVGVELQSVKRSDGSSKVWYLVRFLDPILRRSRSDFLPFLRGVGSFTQVMSEDILVGGLAQQSAGTVTLLQENPDVDLLSQLLDYSFAGFTCTIKLGEYGVDSYPSWQTFATSTIDQEPSLSLVDTGIQLTFPLATVISRLLSEQLQITRNVGIPTCIRLSTATGTVTVPYLPAYDLSEFTCMVRFRTVSGPPTSGNMFLHRKHISETSSNWNIRILQTSGLVNFHTSHAGVADIDVSTTASLADNEIHTAIFSFSTLILTAYCLVDDALIARVTPAGAPDTPSEDIRFGNASTPIEILDARLYNYYIPQDEASAIFSTRSNGDELGCIGLWRFDDNEDDLTEAADYSPTANNAHLHGTVNTDWSWRPSDLGEPEQSGTPQPFVLGIPFNARAVLIDHFRSRFRVADVDIVDEVAAQTIAIRSRALPLVVTTDYTDQGDGVYQTVDAEPEPITYDVLEGGSINYLTNILSRTLPVRSSLDSSSIDQDQLSALAYLCPWSIGYYIANDLTGSDLLTQLASTSGFSYYEDVEGRLFLDFLLPPIGMGPYDQPCLDFRGRPDNRIIVGDTADISGSHSLVCWFYTHATDETANVTDSLQAPPIGQFLIDKGNNYSLSVDLEGGAAGRIAFSHLSGLSLGTLYAPAGIISSGVWQFIAGVLDDSAKTRKIYYGRLGDSAPTLISSDSGWTGSPTPNDNYLAVGGASPSGSDKSYTWGSVSHTQVWDKVLTLSDLTALMVTPPVGTESNLLAYVPAIEGRGLAKEKVSNVDCSIGNSVWVPTLTIDLNIHPSIKLVDIKHILPASKIVIKYRRNWSPLTDADIATTATPSARSDHKRQWSEVSTVISRSSKKTRTIILETPLTDQDDALRLLRFMAYRFSDDQYIATLDFPSTVDSPGDYITRRALASSMRDEVLLRSDKPVQLVNGRSFRIVGLTRDPLNMSVRMVLLG